MFARDVYGMDYSVSMALPTARASLKEARTEPHYVNWGSCKMTSHPCVDFAGIALCLLCQIESL